MTVQLRLPMKPLAHCAGQPDAFDRVWWWRTNLPERKDQRCRIIARGTMNSCQIEFEDGERHICSRFAVRKIRGSSQS